MTKARHLARAPINEALIELRVKFSPDFDPNQLRELIEVVKPRMPRMEERYVVEFEHKFGVKIDGEQPQSKTIPKGLHSLIFRSDDNLDVAQFRIDGFAFSRLKPYIDWEYLIGKAKEYWNIYSSLLHPESITRVAVRYINRIQLTLPFDYSAFFTTPLPIPPGCKDNPVGFLTRVQTKHPKEEIITNATQTFEQNLENGVSIILDFDVFKQREWEIDDPKIWETLEFLRHIKNKAFFDSITEKTVGLFDDEND